MRGSGLGRRTLKMIPYYPSPREIYQRLIESRGYPYKNNVEFNRSRDRALISIIYLAGLRVSETLRLRRSQFKFKPEYIEVEGIKLSKSRVKGKPRRVQYRNARLPLKGERAPLTNLVVDYITRLKDDERLFKFESNQRAWQIVKAYFPEWTTHWLRAFCEDYLYDRWGHDLLAVADYVKVSPRTLEQYIRRRYERYPVV